jgi:hypothetical protein
MIIKRFIGTFAVIATAAMLMAPLAGCSAKKNLEAGSVWEITETTKLTGLTIAEGATIKAPKGRCVTMTVYGTETNIAPGDYAGDIVLTLTDNFKISGHKEAMANWARADFRAAVFLGKNGIIDSNSVLAAAKGYQYSNDILTITDTIKSAGEKFNGIIVNAGTHEIKDVKIAFDGDGGNDFIGYGAGILVTGDTTEATLDNVNINTKGLVRTALTVAGSAKVLVKNSTLIALQGALPKGYIANAENVNGYMKAAPWTLGLDGTNRATNLLGYGTVTFFNSNVSSEGWGILSSDDTVAIKQNVINSTIKSDGPSVYGSFGMGSGSVINILGSIYDISGFLVNIAGGILNIGPVSAENLAEVYGADIIMTDSRYDANVNSTLKSSRFGISASNNSSVNIKAGTVINTGLSSFISKGGNTTINADGATITANNGIIFQLMDSDDAGADFTNPSVPFRTSYTEESGVPVRISGRDLTTQNHDYAGKKLDIQSMLLGKKLYINKSSGLDVAINFSNMTLNGNIFNSTESFVNEKNIGVTSSASNLHVNLKNVQYKGDISSSKAEHIDVSSGKPIKTITNYKEVSYVRNAPREVINNGVNVVLSGNSVWTVTSTSYLSRLTIGKDSAIVALEGYKLTMTVDGVEKAIKAGTYKGTIMLTVTNG